MIKKYFLKNKSLKIFSIVFLLFTSFILFLNTNLAFKLWDINLVVGGKRISIEKLTSVRYTDVERFTHQFNLKKAFINRGFRNDDQSINIDLSYEDIKSFQKFYYRSTQLDGLRLGMLPGGINRGYLVDEINFWRNASISFPGIEKQKVKIKLHGTSPSPAIDSFSYTNRIKQRLQGKISENHFDISRGGFAFKIKIKSDGEFYNGKRRLNFISPWDDWDLVGNSLNKYIKEFGVITTSGEVKRLFINGSEIGPYLVVENINKELLERDFNITNYAVFKNNDDWNKSKSSAHNSTTDFTSYDMEGSGEENTIKIALTKLKMLMDSLEREDINEIRKFLDVDNLAKIAALINITGSVHPLFGDNTKYIYDFASGKFQLGYRLEGGVIAIGSRMPESFDRQSYNLEMNKILKVFLKEKWFIDKRNAYLQKILNEREKIFSIIESDKKSFSKVLSNSNYPTKKYEYYHKIFSNKLSYNLTSIDNYLNYTKIYSTLVKDNDSYLLHVLHDSYSPSYIKSVKSCSGEVYYLDNFMLKSSEYDVTSGLIQSEASEIKIEVPFGCISEIDAYKNLINESIDNKHIYINYAISYESISEANLSQLSNGLKLNHGKNNSKTYILKKGNYILNQDLAFPFESNVIFEPGVNIKIAENKSIYITGNFLARGTENLPITVSSLDNKNSFGTFAILGTTSKPSDVNMKYFKISKGSEAVINGTYFSSQLSIHFSDLLIQNSIIKDSSSDDGINIKFSNVKIINSKFYNNFADQIDLDYSNGLVENNNFYYEKEKIDRFDVITDGLDISGSNVIIKNNLFKNMTDKGISVGEGSRAIITNNTFKANNSAIAIKDSSMVCVNRNSYQKNVFDLNAYIKKKMYDVPNVFYEEQQKLTLNKNGHDDAFNDSFNIECSNWLKESI